jgi:hypothetical protein
MTSSLVKEQPGAFLNAPLINWTDYTTARHPLIAGLQRQPLQKWPGFNCVKLRFFRLRTEHRGVCSGHG